MAIPCTGRSAMSLRLMCDWKPCQGTHFKTREALSEHQEAHSRTLITTAKNEGLFECSWQDCDRKEVKKFKSLAALKKHLKQHVRGQWCLHGNCNAAFSRKSDLERHVQTKHSSDRTYLCPVDTCDRSVDGFKRKDKLDDHIKKVHARFQCTFDHCESKVLEIEKQVHLDQFHDGKPELAPSPSRMMGRSGIFECNLFGCESTISKFKISSACKHLRRCHGVSYDTDFAYTNAAVGNGPKSIRGGAFVLQPSPRLGVKHKPCTHCISNATVDDNVKTGIDQAT